MFQSALIRRHSSADTLVDAGVIAETLLFYQNVHVVADRGLLTGILRAIGPDNLATLLRDKRITLSYSRSLPVVMTNNKGNVPTHLLTAVSFGGVGTRTRLSNRQEITEVLEMEMGKNRKSKMLAETH